MKSSPVIDIDDDIKTLTYLIKVKTKQYMFIY